MPGAKAPDPQAGTGAASSDDDAGAGAATGSATGAATGGAAATGAGEPKPLQLTQEELDAIVTNRTAQARRQAREAEADAKAWREHQAAQQTEAEKADAARKAEEARLAEVNAKINARAIATEVRLIAVEQGVRKEALGDVILLVAGSPDIAVADDGTVSGAEIAVKAVLKDRAYLLAEKTPPARSGAAFGGQVEPTLAEKITAAEAAKKPRDSIALKMTTLGGG